MAVTTSTNPNGMWSAIIALITAQMGTGNSLAALLDVRRSAQFATDKIPAACVQWMGFDPSDYSNRTRLITQHFRISVVTSSGGSASVVANLDDAMATLVPLVDDGAGNGIVPLLGGPTNFGLGGLAQETRLGKAKLAWEIHEGPGQLVMAFAFLDYDAIVQVRSS